jgi:hypothetical protein
VEYEKERELRNHRQSRDDSDTRRPRERFHAVDQERDEHTEHVALHERVHDEISDRAST